jgi:lipoprotein-releasing system ATP-binding protein
MDEATAGSGNIVIAASNLAKRFIDGKRTLTVFEKVSLAVAEGESLAIVGASGAGKSTLLHLLGGLDRPDEGSVRIDGTDIARLSDANRSRLRNRALGFVYQFHHLLPEFSALDNVAMPLLLRRESLPVARAAARDVLQRVGLGDRESHKPAELSGGERQRAAVARALVTRPRALLADEPTGNLDRDNAARVFELLLTLNRELGTALVVVTHDEHLAARMQRIHSLDELPPASCSDDPQAASAVAD